MADTEEWEYYVATFTAAGVERMKNDLNQLGASGWELVTATAMRFSGADYVLVFKRRGRGHFVERKNDDAGWGG